jgi:hypothetical protein
MHAGGGEEEQLPGAASDCGDCSAPRVLARDSVSFSYSHTASSREVAGGDYAVGADPDEISPGASQPLLATGLSLVVTWGLLWWLTAGLGLLAQALRG